MILLDSNIVIYLTQPGNEVLYDYFSAKVVQASIISYVEVLGFHGITDEDKVVIEAFFEITPILPLSTEIADRAVRLRQTRKIGLGDSLIAATAIENDLILATHNTADFAWIESLNLIDPLGIG